MGRITDQLNAIVSSEEKTDELYSIFRTVNDYDIPVIRFYIGAGSSLIRQRVNEKGKEYNLVKDLYYPPAINIKGYGRANLPYQSMFYACCFSLDPDEPLPRMLTLMETSSFFKNTESSGIERATCSRWLVKDRIELIVLPFYTHYDRPCKMITEIQTQWDDAIKNADINEDARELVDYILYVNEKTKDADGVMYPSVPGAGAGFNVVLKKESADAKIEFERSSLMYLVKNKMKSYEFIVNYSFAVSDEGVITYVPRVVTEKEKNEYEKYAEGLEIIN